MTNQEKKKVIFSGIQPSGEFTLGNYFGAIKNWGMLQDEYDCIFSVVDMHAITVLQVPADLRRRSFECSAMLLASGIDPEKSKLFIQSHVPAHAELAWILNCYTYMGELSRMTQFKDKAKNQGENIRVGLYDYPVLMVADILLYQADVVPVGVDQNQHLELTRTVAHRFNTQYSPTFVVPEAYLGSSGAKIMSLSSPEKKMSKSDENKNGFILMKDDRDTIISKFKKAVTDSDTVVRYDKVNKAGVSNLLEIYSCATSKTIEESEKEFASSSYAELKLGVAEAVADSLAPIQSEYERLLKEKDYVESVLKKGAESAQYIARKTLDKVKKKIGYLKI